ncbi:hypothetical protein N7468_010326 [Penicillium chermesinum]|uniref:Uncharacterized protein n=1 Tax=Penicillium chermesinum TaxID=63820 RepID=A0A9W9NCJ3_9EURO|nr:uncharacterized protein N7468_010326 [Penicillium chermesinum]KAJ5217318.1 hypothetical protein N7468_010326 [Penicillium chermesinum]
MACDLATLPEMRVPSSMTLDEIDQFLAPSHFSVGLDDDDLTLMKHLTDYNKRAANNFSPPDVESVLQTQTINPALLDLSRNESSPDGLLQSGMGSPAAPDIADVPQMTTSPTGPAFLSSSNDPFFGSSSPSPSSPGTPCPTPSLIRQGRLHTRSPEVQQVQQQEAMHYAKSKQNTDRLQPACMPPPAIPASSMSQNPQMHHVGRLPTSPSPTNPEMWIHAAGDQFPMGYPPRVPAPGLIVARRPAARE